MTGPPEEAARSAFAQGLFRRGVAVLNRALQDNPELLTAWVLKSRFMHSLGFNRTAAEMIAQAQPLMTPVASRIRLSEEQSYLWAECNRGEDALRSAEVAVTLGSQSVPTYYLRGRALALLGRLEEARQDMRRVLELDPTNADAIRALGMIDAAAPPAERKA